MTVKNLAKRIFGRHVTRSQKLNSLFTQGRTRVAVDFSDWMHKALVIVCVELVEGEYHDACKRIRRFFRSRVLLFCECGATSVHFVRDGGTMPAKGGVDTDRKKERDDALAKAVVMLDDLPADMDP